MIGVVLQVLHRDLVRRPRVFIKTYPELGVRVVLDRLCHRTSGWIIAHPIAGPMGSQTLRISHSGDDFYVQYR